MEQRRVWTSVQSIGVIGACSAFAYSISCLPNMEASDGPVLALVGAIIGFIGVLAGLILRPRVAEFERRGPPLPLICLRIATVGGLIAGAGWLIVVFISYRIGFPIAVIGIVTGVVGVVSGRILLASRR
jgi:hypothetical protein